MKKKENSRKREKNKVEGNTEKKPGRLCIPVWKRRNKKVDEILESGLERDNIPL